IMYIQAARGWMLAMALAGSILPAGWAQRVVDPPRESVPHRQVLDWDTGAGASSRIPTVEIPVFLVALNLYDRAVYGREVYGTTFKSTWDHVRKESWEFDEDPFNVN